MKLLQEHDCIEFRKNKEEDYEAPKDGLKSVIELNEEKYDRPNGPTPERLKKKNRY